MTYAVVDSVTHEQLAEIESQMTSTERREVDRLLDGALPLTDYVKGAWKIMEPTTPLVWGWHIEVICEHLEAVVNGEIQHLIINVPPRHMKSNLVMVCFPTWVWTFAPGKKILGASYSHDLSKRDAVKSRSLMVSKWYQSRWGHKFRFTGDQNEKMRYNNNKGGYRIATSTGGTVTGEGGDIRMIDDPHKTSGAGANNVGVLSETQRLSDLQWLSEVWSSRVTDPKTASDIIIMQRLHEMDATGHALKEIGGYTHLCLPGRYEEARPCRVQIGSIDFEDPRTEEGELLWAEQWSEAATSKLEHALGSYGTASQIQQRPTPAGGGIIKKIWFNFYHQADLPRAFERTLQSWDFAFKKTDTSSHIAGQVWAKLGSRHFLLYRELARMDIVESITAVRRVTAMYPLAVEKLMEDKANGPAIMQMLDTEITGIIPIEVGADKTSRMNTVAPFVEAGNVWLPHPDECPWVLDFIENVCSYPKGSTTDDGDSMIQALMRFMFDGGTGLAALEKAMGDGGTMSSLEEAFS